MIDAGAVHVGPAGSDDLPAILALLSASGLPTSDLTAPARTTRFLVLRDGGVVVGVIGIEQFGDTALLRSLAVHAGHRGRGLGAHLVRALEQHARESGISSLVLLTESAQEFFHTHGYQVLTRASAPAALQASTEFLSLCPSSAVCMRKTL